MTCKQAVYQSYFRHRPEAYSLIQFSIAAKTYHRNRKDAEVDVAHHLEIQEEQIRRG